MKKKLFTLPVLALAIVFSSTLFTSNANADHNVKRHKNYKNHGEYVSSHRGNKYGHYKNNKHYKKSYKSKKYDRDRYRYDKHRDGRHRHHRYSRKDDTKFFFSLVLPITHLFNGYDSHYDGY